MKKYLVKKTNYGFRGRYWVEGQIISFDDDVVPNKHFELITSATKMPVPEKEQISPATLSQAQTLSKKEPTAAEALKHQTGVAEKPLSKKEKEQLASLDESAVGKDTAEPSTDGQGAI